MFTHESQSKAHVLCNFDCFFRNRKHHKQPRTLQMRICLRNGKDRVAVTTDH